MANLKDEVREIIEIVALVPEEFKATCFEMLLKEVLTGRRIPPTSQPITPAIKGAASTPTVPAQDEAHATGNEEVEKKLATSDSSKISDGSDIVLSDLHMKTRKFVEKSDVSIEQLNNLLYKNNGNFEWLISDLGVTGMAEGQFRISLLQCLHNALATGNFETEIESVRDECKMRKYYDQDNFASNIKRNVDYFDFGTWTKDVTKLRLSEDGRKTLAKTIKTYK